MMTRFLVFIFVLWIDVQSVLADQRQVALELVLAIDTSSSVDAEAFELQRQGIAEAFQHPDLISVIEGMGQTGIAVVVVEWSGKGQQQQVTEWSLLNSRISSLSFANAVLRSPRRLKGSTDIGSALKFAINAFENNTFSGNRKVIDVSGDGRDSGNTSRLQRDRAISRGITINGLVIFNDDVGVGAIEEVDLVRQYSNTVIGGNGAFLMTAKGFDDFRNAIRRKLIREILGTGTAALRR